VFKDNGATERIKETIKTLDNLKSVKGVVGQRQNIVKDLGLEL
jgi:hypothetical protein